MDMLRALVVLLFLVGNGILFIYSKIGFYEIGIALFLGLTYLEVVEGKFKIIISDRRVNNEND